MRLLLGHEKHLSLGKRPWVDQPPARWLTNHTWLPEALRNGALNLFGSLLPRTLELDL